jgi:hypothetical protein
MIKKIFFTLLMHKELLVALALLSFTFNIAKADVIGDAVKKYKLDTKSNPKDLCKLMFELEKVAEKIYTPSIIDSNLVPFYDSYNMPSSAFDTLSVQDETGHEIANFFIVFDTKFTTPLGIIDIHGNKFKHGYIFSQKNVSHQYKYSDNLPKEYNLLLEFDNCKIKQLIINQ